MDEIAVHDAVRVQVTGRIASTRDSAAAADVVFLPRTPLWIEVGAQRGDVVPALEMAVRFTRGPGHVVRVWSHAKYAHGTAGRRRRPGDDDDDDTVVSLPPDTHVSYDVECLQRVSADALASSPALQLELAQARKAQTRAVYETEWADGQGRSRVLQAYERLAKDAEALLERLSSRDDLTAAARALRVDALNNVTAVHLRARDYHAAKAAAVRVLQVDPDNAKALVRAAKAALLDPSSAFEEVELALEHAAAAATHHHDNARIRADIEKLTADFARRKQAYARASKKMYQKAFATQKKNETPKKDNNDDNATTPVATLNHGDDHKPPPTTTTDSEKSATTTTDSNQASTDWKKLWWNIILPYGFQIILTMTMVGILIQQRYQASHQLQAPPTQNDGEEF